MTVFAVFLAVVAIALALGMIGLLVSLVVLSIRGRGHDGGQPIYRAGRGYDLPRPDRVAR